MMNPLRTIVASAAEADLAFLLAGGHAVIAHGHPRNTFDLDLIIRREDRDGWLKLAQGLKYSPFHEGPTFIQFNPPNSDMLPLDLMLVSADTFAGLMADAVPAPAGAASAKIVSLHHLLALKCHAIKYGHAARIVKDVDDVINLVKANRLDMAAPEMRDLFLKHGPAELYEKVRRASLD
jgi:hypothetical protein